MERRFTEGDEVYFYFPDGNEQGWHKGVIWSIAYFSARDGWDIETEDGDCIWSDVPNDCLYTLQEYRQLKIQQTLDGE